MGNRANVTFAALLAMLSGVSGCSPSKTGISAREEAHERMNLVGAQIHFDQARQAFNAGQFDKAMREINHAIARYPDSADYHLLKGRISLETHQLESAIESLNGALEKKPDFPDAHYYSGIVYQRWSRDQNAYESYRRAFDLAPTNVQYLLASAETLVALGELEQAEELIDSKLSYFEHNAALRQLLGQIALLRGEAKEAADIFAQARLLNPDDVILLEELMWAQFHAGQYGHCLESIRQLQEPAAAGVERPDLIHVEAQCLVMLDRATEARTLFMNLTRLRPTDVEAWCQLGSLAWDLGDWRRVAESSVQVIALAPDRHEGYLLKGVYEQHQGNIREAVGLFEQGAERAGRVGLPHLLLGQALEQTGDFDGAAHAYLRAREVDPTSPQAVALLRRLEERRLTAAGGGQPQ